MSKPVKEYTDESCDKIRVNSSNMVNQSTRTPTPVLFVPNQDNLSRDEKVIDVNTEGLKLLEVLTPSKYVPQVFDTSPSTNVIVFYVESNKEPVNIGFVNCLTIFKMEAFMQNYLEDVPYDSEVEYLFCYSDSDTERIAAIGVTVTHRIGPRTKQPFRCLPGYRWQGRKFIKERQVRPVEWKWFNELVKVVSRLNKGIRHRDWVSLQRNFSKMNKQFEKAMKDTKSSEIILNLYIKVLVKLEDFSNQSMANKAAKKEMSSSNAKALNAMKHKLMKNKRQYEVLITNWRENPGREECELDETSEEESEVDDETSEEECEVDDEMSEEEFKVDDETSEEELQDWSGQNTWGTINKKFREIIAKRGRKGT
ncbi:hypothetical protein POM88_029640 [Heracleum sosnowskyi]|uniref:Eukaryotic translation initiation factor 3 subunit C N-terminal domain-containing protein n=1 Tax=Heracleum sosnowskyi TaxID=360622 RepID=A0AAD8HU18_9APIA|nr:hypothetical protein POM88_029640 [Heracleum sosnowskyi]